MKYFTKIAEGIDVGPALMEIKERGGTVPPRPDSGAIERGYKDPEPAGVRVLYSPFDNHPAVQQLFETAMNFLGRVVVRAVPRVRILPPRSAMKPHRDHLPSTWARYHLAMQCDEKAALRIEDEECCFKAGELWQVYLADRLHYAVNDSPHPRVVMVIDGDLAAPVLIRHAASFVVRRPSALRPVRRT